MRKAGYTGGAYRNQYEHRAQSPFPVIEFVLYWGMSGWKGSRDSRRLFRGRTISEDAWSYIDELKLHVFEMRHLPKETRKLFQSDMRIVVDFLAEGSSYHSNRKIMHKAALIRMIKVLSGDMDVERIEDWMTEQQIREEDEVTVCELFDQYERRGEKRGMEKGIKRGKEEGRIEGEDLLARLAQLLMDSGRSDGLRRVLSDRDCWNQLYLEAGPA